MPRIHEFPNMAFQFSIDVLFMTYEGSTPTRVKSQFVLAFENQL